jgi:hypothetical protein
MAEGRSMARTGENGRPDKARLPISVGTVWSEIT